MEWDKNAFIFPPVCLCLVNSPAAIPRTSGPSVCNRISPRASSIPLDEASGGLRASGSSCSAKQFNLFDFSDFPILRKTCIFLHSSLFGCLFSFPPVFFYQFVHLFHLSLLFCQSLHLMYFFTGRIHEVCFKLVLTNFSRRGFCSRFSFRRAIVPPASRLPFFATPPISCQPPIHAVVGFSKQNVFHSRVHSGRVVWDGGKTVLQRLRGPCL